MRERGREPPAEAKKTLSPVLLLIAYIRFWVVPFDYRERPMGAENFLPVRRVYSTDTESRLPKVLKTPSGSEVRFIPSTRVSRNLAVGSCL